MLGAGSWGVCLYKESLGSELRATKKSQGQSPGMWTKIPATTGIDYFLQPQLVNPGFLVAINSKTSLFIFLGGMLGNVDNEPYRFRGPHFPAVGWYRPCVGVSFTGHVKWYSSLFRSVTTRTGTRLLESGVEKSMSTGVQWRFQMKPSPSCKGFEAHQVRLQLIGGWKRGRTK